MDGCVRRERRSVERDLALAWHTANFGAAAQAGKLKGMSRYLREMQAPANTNTADEAAATFKVLEARGFAKIRIVPKGDVDGR